MESGENRRRFTGALRRLAALAACLAAIGAISGFAAEPLHVYAGAALRPAIETLAERYRQETGQPVVVEYGGSGQMAARILATRAGDVFVAGAMPDIETLQRDGAVASSQPLAEHAAVLAVNKSARERITRFDDLAKPGVRIALGDPKAMALGRTAEEILSHSDKREAILANVVTRALTMSQLTMYVVNGDVDAAIIGPHDVMKNAGKLVAVPLPPNVYQPEVVGAAVLNSSVHPDDARRFVALLASPQGKAALANAGFPPLPAR
ncbi:molybdate ABC transporter substrate-binding protein [Martelella alba]|uniref:Molybdate ABC transporter substrate-binding protein n=1 Tax=Martelella alba TaxID=2590451 RepID=A0ABY2SF41_9HYPH|nr:molybdate ABC transporter substrate-binding protein [Martelella alba]TKI03505.1 molybdate ABC transporter substrate-binding protein [Martelella alba]